nr:PE-38 [Pieris rapae granulovirus]
MATIKGFCFVCTETYEQSGDFMGMFLTPKECSHPICYNCVVGLYANAETQVRCPTCRVAVLQWEIFTKKKSLTVKFVVQNTEEHHNNYNAHINYVLENMAPIDFDTSNDDNANDNNTLIELLQNQLKDAKNLLDNTKKFLSQHIIKQQLEIENLRQIIFDLNSEQENLNSQQENLRNQNNSLTRELKIIESENFVYETTIDELNNQYKFLQKQIIYLKNFNENLVQKCNDFANDKKKIANLQIELEKTKCLMQKYKKNAKVNEYNCNVAYRKIKQFQYLTKRYIENP